MRPFGRAGLAAGASTPWTSWRPPPMLRYTAVRVAFAIPVLFGVLTVTFVLTHVLPTNPAALVIGSDSDKDAVQQMERQLGLDRPILTQFGDYLSGLADGDLGKSLLSGNSVARELTHRIPATLELITFAIPLAFLVGIGFAMLAAGRHGGVRDAAARAVGTFGIAVPDYFFAIIVVLVFYATLRWAPGPLGQAGPAGPEVPSHTGAYFIDSIIAGNPGAVGVAASHLVLPVLVLALHYASSIYRVARASMEDLLDGPFVDYITMMGVRRRVVWRAVIRNAMPPILTITGSIYGMLLGGAVLVEVIFAWGGIGQYSVESILRNDYLVIQGFVLIAATFTVVVFLGVDLLHAWLDPRVRRSL